MLKTSTATILTILAASTLVGCNNGDSDVSYGKISGDLTPELNSTAQRRIDEDRNEHVVRNMNYRMMTDDINRFLLTDTPSRLSPYPIVDTSGNPR